MINGQQVDQIEELLPFKDLWGYMMGNKKSHAERKSASFILLSTSNEFLMMLIKDQHDRKFLVKTTVFTGINVFIKKTLKT